MVMEKPAVTEKKEDGVIKVCISIPNAGYTHVESYFNRLLNFMHLGKIEERGILNKENPRFEFYFSVLGRIFTPLAREEAADQCLESNCDYLYMIDDDMICPNDMFEQLYRHNVDLVAPLAFTRNFPHHAVIYRLEEGFNPCNKQPFFINRWIDKYPENQLVECDAVGFGAVLIKAEVLKKVEKPRFMCSSGTGEDVLFCHKARKAGFRIFMDTSLKLGHLSHPVEVTEDYVKNVHEMRKHNPSRPTYSTKEPILVLGD
jgi:hypothetical protein